ncbi:MAG: hypothetical protein II943_05800 [Victivallales bacterium]|nr:hypothetical protein [Victivallales bacterium]
MSDSRNHSWYLLLAALGITVLMCISISAVFTGHRLSSGQGADSVSDTMVSAESPVEPLPETTDGEAIRWHIVLPQDYKPELPYPVVFEYATGKPQLANLQPGQAILASYDAQTDAPLKAFLAEADALNRLEALRKEYHIDDERIYLVTADLAGLSFAARHASRFSAAVLQFTADPAPDAWEELPLRNLDNLEFCLDSSRLPLPGDSLRKLRDKLESTPWKTPDMMEFPVAPTTSSLPAALANLSMTLPLHLDKLHWQTDSLANGEAWWLRAEGLEKYGEEATFSGQYEPGNLGMSMLQVDIKTGNLNAFAIKRTWKDFSEVRTFILNIDGQRVPLPTRPIDPEWCVLRKKDGTWQPDSAPPPENCKTGACEGPIARVLQAPFLIVAGTADSDTAAQWQQSAQALAAHCHQFTGQEATVIADSACTPEVLEGHHLILLGGPRENLLASNILDGNPEFLRDIYLLARTSEEHNALPMETPNLCCMTLSPAGIYSPNNLALIVLADNPADIAEAWRPFFTPLATQGDFLLFRPRETNPCIIGWCSSTWDISN